MVVSRCIRTCSRSNSPPVARTLPQLRRHQVTELRGVGERKAEALRELEVENILDLLTLYPRRYLDRTSQATIADLGVGQEATLLVTVQRCSVRRIKGGRSMVEAEVTDGKGRLRLTFFNQPWRTKQLGEGAQAAVFGKLELFRGRAQMTNPVVDLVGDRTGRIIPVYPQSEKAGIMTWEVAAWVDEALERAGELADPLPLRWRQELDLQDRTWSFRNIHAPASMAAAQVARRRLAFDELLRLQLLLVQRKRRVERDSIGIRHVTDGELVSRFVDALPYDLTGAQQRAIAEISADLAGPHPMHRLLQGDV